MNCRSLTVHVVIGNPCKVTARISIDRLGSTTERVIDEPPRRRNRRPNANAIDSPHLDLVEDRHLLDDRESELPEEGYRRGISLSYARDETR